MKTDASPAAPSASEAGPSYPTASMRAVEIASTPTLPPPFGPSSAYAQTSQARNWRFSPSTLATIRENGNAAARRRLEALWNEENAESSSSTSSIPFLSVEDELALITYYLVKVTQIVRAFGLPELVEATATTFVKRFYLRNTCMDFHPKNIVITCIFLASKTENYPLSLSEFARKLAGKAATDAAVVEENRRTVLDLEFLVSQSLQFEYAVVGAHRALYGLVLDLQSLPEGAPTREQVHKVAAAAQIKLGNSRLTDAEFVYTPSQIALACIRGAGDEGQSLVNKWLDAKEARARTVSLSAKAKRIALREAEAARVAKAKIALARRTKGKAGAKAAEDEMLISASTPAPSLEFDETLLDTQPLGLSRSDLDKVLDDIEALIAARESGGYTGNGKGPDDVERVKEIDKRQKQCMNPEKVPGSRLYRKRQADEQLAAQQGAPGATGKRPRRLEHAVDSDDDEVPEAKDFAVKPDPQV